ncbi:hypothetical protein FPZ12_008055 [Amycolatopsis acidicola]|uniref:Cupin domain-containing protein n=1 Tax=Amycolatopsis acidicola TaxID=2596893 RepID=A0A5N0VEW1_9PSEU|nr:hypothetical protein [Amycolatopsis acidicola]KAA9163974.1 hypothetical protein FPZ12_008055 [Amycolatopsis acidicola]
MIDMADLDHAVHRQAFGANTTLHEAGDSETAIIAHPDVPTERLSAGRLHLPGGKTTTPQRHPGSEIILATISGYAAVLSGEPATLAFPKPGDMTYVPPGVGYRIVNLSRNASLLVLTIHTDPGFFDDRDFLPALGDHSSALIEQLRDEHVRRIIGRRASGVRRPR